MGIEDKKSGGGEKLDQEAIRNIASAVKGLIDQDKEKGKTTQDLGTVKKEVGELKGELGKIKEGMHCDPSGRYCFRTPQELSDFMEKQATKMEGIEGKLATVVEKVSNMKPPKAELPEGFEPLEKMTAETRIDMTEEGNRARDGQVDKIEDYFNVTDNDRWRKLRRNEVNVDVISGKPEIVSRVLKAIPSMPQDQKGKITQVICTDKECRVTLEKEQGARIYKQDGKGRWKWLDEPEKEGPHI